MEKRGFTLLEAMTTCAVVAILTGLAVNSWQSAIRQARNNDGVMAVYGQLLAARKEARAHNQPVRLVLLTDAGTPLARWEQLPCDNQTFGLGCPSVACATTTGCGVSGCPCVDTGAWIAVPPTVDLTAWAGLCFQGGTGQAVPRATGVGDCLGPVPGGIVSLRASIHDQPDQLLQLEPVTGQPRLLACDGVDAGCH
ncbi:MAG TPA: prepilin-type N-terminal cleavage/methylation domain-containing protein [Myxococcaceae bacterium]|nr:prepilin-type N-terminal cleavage/methylation domain-containing protein [Myxococcaceae bacterium]